MLPNEGAGDVGNDIFELVAVEHTFRVNADATTTPVVLLTAYNVLYAVTYSWFITQQTFDTFGAKGAATIKTGEVSAVCQHPHVQGFRSEQDQDRSSLLYNYAVVTVGTDDLRITTNVSQRMDQINSPSMFSKIDAAWEKLVQLGAGSPAPLA